MNKRIMLIVDDNEINQGLLISIFEDAFIIKTANDGYGALRQLDRYGTTISVVLLDLVMPDMGGFDVLAAMQEKPDLRSIPVIIVSSQTEREASLRAVRCGAVDFVTKPVDPDWLEIKVEAAISKAENAEKLRFQAERDALTGLYNRTTFFEKAAEMIAAHAPGYYVMAAFDIDNFKVINDQYGTEKGDGILGFIADTFRGGLNPVGGLVGRISADNFAAIHPASLLDTGTLDEISKVASMLDGSIPPIRFSIGRYLAEDLTLSPSAMYDRAALAKASIKRRYDTHFAWYDESMRDRVIREQEIVNEMNVALQTGQFEVWLQPQVNHATRALIGAEALVRWRHPSKGIVSPGDFIPVFERNGFIYELDKYVWEQSCLLLRRWILDGHEPLPLSVNISRNDLFHNDLVDVITGYVIKYNIPIDLLRLEITESAFAQSTKQVVRVVKRLIGHGFTVEIDDFGSGYSSLNTLKDVPAHILKLDMRFLENSEDEGRGGNVLESIVRMAKWLGMSVIAEGVETVEQADFLKSIGCVYIQGYLYARPMPVREYETLARQSGKEEKLLTMETVKNLDNNAFWDPNSMDTLIFNSYVGSACIAEYHGGRIEMLRATDKFIQMLGSKRMTIDDVLKLNWIQYLGKESKKRFKAAIADSIETKDEVNIESTFLNLPGCARRTHLRGRLRVIATAGDRCLVYCTNENITKQREAEDKERASTEQLQAIMANIEGGVTLSIIRNGAPQVQFANEQFYAMRGYTKEQYKREVTNTGTIVHPDDRALMLRITSTAEEPFSMVYRIVRRDGGIRWMLNKVSFVRLPQFDEQLQLSVTNDITELREAEEKERAAAEQLQIIMANIDGGVTAAVVKDGVPHILFANERFYSQYGYTKAEYDAEVDNPHDLLHPDDAERVARETAEASRMNQPFNTVCRIIGRDGSIRWLQTRVTIIRLTGVDDPVQLAVTADITAQKELEEKERANAAQLQVIMNNINGGVSMLILRRGIPQLQFANEQFYSLMGYTKEQFDAEVVDPRNIIHIDDREKVFDKAASIDKPTTLVYRIIRRDGTVRWMQNNISIVRMAGFDEPVQMSVTNDITELREAERKEHEMSERLQAILSALNSGVSGVTVTDGKLHYVFANDRYYSMLGYTREQFEAEVENGLDLIHPEDRARIDAQLAQIMATGGRTIFEYRVIKRDGEIIHVRVNGSVLMLDGVDAPVSLGVSADVTDMVKARQQIASLSRRLQITLNALNSGVTGVTVKNGKVDYVFTNDKYYSMMGYTREQFEAEVHNGLDLIHPEDRARIQAEVELLAREEGYRTLEYRVIHRDGQTLHFRVTITSLHIEGVEGLINLSVCTDITDLVKAQQKITTLSERMQVILDNVDSGITTAEVEGDHIEYLFGNNRFFALHGYTMAQYEAEVKNPFDMVHPDDRQRMRDTVNHIHQTGGSADAEYRIIRRDGETRCLRALISMRQLSNEPRPVQFTVYTDITEEKLAQEKQRATNEQLQFLNDTASELLAHTDVAVGINRVLHLVLACFGADRAFIIEHSHADNMCTFTFEACRQGVPSCREEYPRFPIDSAWYWKQAFRKARFILIPDVDRIGDDRAVERGMMQSIGARSALAVSLHNGGMNIGTLGVFNPTMHLDDYDNLRALSDYVSIILARRDLHARIERDREMLQTLMDDMPGGFSRLRLKPDADVATEYVNNHFCHMRGMTREEILAADSQNAMDTVHPDDVVKVRQAVAEMVSTGETRSLKYRLRRGDGSYVQLSAFGRVTGGEGGARFINVYYASLSEQEKKEQTIRETIPFILSAILASSTALAFAKDMDSRYICGSAEFMKMTNLTHEREIIGKTDHELFRKEIADVLHESDMQLLKTGQPMLNIVQALPLADGSLHYYNLSKYVLRDASGKMLGIYGLGRDITEERDAFARLRLLVDSIPGGIASYIASPDGIRITYFNDGFCNILGYTRAEYEAISATGITNVTFAEDVPRVLEQARRLVQEDISLNCTYRVHTKGGGYKWVNTQGRVAQRHGDVCVINTVLYDVTERVEAENALRISEEELRIAASIDGRTVARYDIRTGVYQHTSQFLFGKGFSSRVSNVPQAFIDAGFIAQDCIPEYRAFYDALRRGDSPCSVDIAIQGGNGAWHWLRENATVICDMDGTPSRAIIVFTDITELREKEAVYRKWQQSLKQRPEDTYMLLRCNLTKHGSFDSAEGSLFWMTFDPNIHSFVARTQEYMNHCVYEEDKAEYAAFMNADALLKEYRHGLHTKALEYREAMPDGTLRWLRLTVELVEYPGSSDVEAFLLYENIDSDKRAELHTRELAETDPLTGVLNRMAFKQAVEHIIQEGGTAKSFAMMLVDLDDFKHINDAFGHAAGDRALINLANTLRSELRKDDLLGRLGGDEFLICLRDLSNGKAIMRKAERICALLGAETNRETHTSASIGIAVYPKDGRDYETLYQKMDTALYAAKDRGKNKCALYSQDMGILHLTPDIAAQDGGEPQP